MMRYRYKTPDGQLLENGQSFTLDGVQYASNTLSIWPHEELVGKLGLIPVEEPEAPPAHEPIKISRLELRRLLKAKEAQWFDEARTTSQPLTAEERDEVFDLNTTNMDLQYKAALRDALLQWDLLDQGVIEMDHSDTASFLTVLGVNGMFGADMATRIPQILAMQPPE